MCSFFVNSNFDVLLSKVPSATYLNVAIHAVNMVVFYPLAGWLADVYFGRYRVICFGIWTMWFGMFTMVLCLILLYALPNATTLAAAVWYGIFPLVYILENVGLAAFQPNIIPFGVDQLQGSVSDEVAAYVHWFVLTMYSSKFVFQNPLSCVSDRDLHTILMALVCVVCLTTAICLNSLCSSYLLVEPESRNPYKMVLKVLKYYVLNKYPRKRSALTYCDEEPSRLDLAKDQYGGPFKTEQVEDVKTFLRILFVLTIVNFFFISAYAPHIAKPYLIRHLSSTTRSSCYEEGFIANMNIYCNVVFIVIHELFIYPTLQKYIPSLIKKFVFALMLFFVSTLYELGIDVAGHEWLAGNTTVPCMFATDGTSSVLNIDYHWVVGAEVLNGLGLVYVNITAFEFICAQSPYSMQGLLIGLMYSMNGIYSTISVLLILPFRTTFPPTEAHSYHSCGFWFFLTNGTVTLIGIFVCSALVKWYRPRMRDEPCNDRRYVEEYFNKYGSVT